jgi:hypothetical protein
MRLLKKLCWAYKKRELEKNLDTFCRIEYRPSDRSWAFHNALEIHKAYFIGDK